MKEKKGVDFSCLVIGHYHLVFTSYIHGSTANNNNAIPMTSTLKDDDEPSYYATPLTQEIIKHGIAWLKGVDKTTLSDFKSMEDALRGYLVTLKEVIPLQQPLDKPEDFSSVGAQAKKFIIDCEWPEGGDNFSSEVADFLAYPNKNKFGEMSNLIR